MAIELTGMTITYQTGYVAELVSWEWTGVERGVIETTSAATSGGKTFMPESNYDPGEMVCEMIHDPETSIVTPITAAAETVTVTFPDAAPASTLAASGFARLIDQSGELGERMTQRLSIKFSGDITHG